MPQSRKLAKWEIFSLSVKRGKTCSNHIWKIRAYRRTEREWVCLQGVNTQQIRSKMIFIAIFWLCLSPVGRAETKNKFYFYIVRNQSMAEKTISSSEHTGACFRVSLIHTPLLWAPLSHCSLWRDRKQEFYGVFIHILELLNALWLKYHLGRPKNYYCLGTRKQLPVTWAFCPWPLCFRSPRPSLPLAVWPWNMA